MREEADAKAVVRRAEPRLGEIDAGVVGRHEVTRERARLRHRRVLEDAAPAQRFREQVADDALHVEPACAAEEVVIGEAALDLAEVDGIEAGADARFARWRLLNVDDHDLGGVGSGDVDRRARLDGGASKKIRLVERSLAAQHLRSLEDVADVEREGLEDGVRADIVVAGDDDVFDCRFVFGNQRERHGGGARSGVDDDGGIDFGIGVALVEHPRLQKEARRVDPDQVQRSVLAQHHPTVDLALRQQRRRWLIDDEAGNERWWTFLNEEGDTDFVGTAFYDGRIDFGFAVAALPVEDADA